MHTSVGPSYKLKIIIIIPNDYYYCIINENTNRLFIICIVL